MIEALESYPVTQTIEGQYLIIRAKHFLQKDVFAKIAQIVKDNGGEYVSAGKNSHFKVPNRKVPEPTRMEASSVVDAIIAGLVSYAEQYRKDAKTFEEMAEDLKRSQKQ